jgi:hypothetical protein
MLAYLRPDRSYEEALAVLLERSQMLMPVERHWDPDLIELLEFTLEWVDLDKRRARERELNDYRPPEVSEWLPADAALPPDDGDEEVDRYLELADQFVIVLHSKIRGFTEGADDEFLAIDRHCWVHDYSEQNHIPDLVYLLGAYLGQGLLKLGGDWVPRRNLDEAQVVLGDRTYLPFVRVRRYLQSKQAVIDYSLTKFLREAERHMQQ